jgi:hypothetical protein
MPGRARERPLHADRGGGRQGRIRGPDVGCAAGGGLYNLDILCNLLDVRCGGSECRPSERLHERAPGKR